MSTGPIEAISAVNAAAMPEIMALQRPVATQGANVSFAELVLDGVDQVSEKANAADALVKSFILDDTVPPHQVMYALEQSHLSLQLMLQVRNRLVEGYQEIMRTQL
jgi:flagellar hook-basal body complex protein FliE